MGEQSKKSFIINAVFIFLWAAIIWFAGKFLLQQLFPFVIAVCVAALMQKPAEKLSSKLHLNKGICAALLSAVLYIAVALFCVFTLYKAFGFVGKAASSLSEINLNPTEIINRLQNIFDNITKNISPNIEETGKKIFSTVFTSFLGKLSNTLSRIAANVVKAAPSVLFSSIVALAATCYIARDYDKLKLFIVRLLKKKAVKSISKIKEILKTCVLKMLAGYLVLMALTFAELTVGLLVLKVKNAVLIAFIIAVVDILPVLGVGAVLLPWGFVGIALGNTAFGIGMLILYLVITVVRNFAEPKIVAAKTGISPLFILLAMFLGLRLLGVAGLIIFPVTLIVIIQYYKNEMEQETS